MISLILVSKLLILVKTKYNNVIEKKLGQGNMENRKQQKRRLQETTTTTKKNSNRIAMVVI